MACKNGEISTGVYLDGAHNADGIRAFLDAACRLKELRKPDHVRILLRSPRTRIINGCCVRLQSG